MEIFGYRVSQVLAEGNTNTVYKAEATTGEYVIIKTVNAKISFQDAQQLLYQEYEINRKMASKSKYFLTPQDFHSKQGQVAIIWNGEGLKTLRAVIQQNGHFTANGFLKLATQVTEAMHHLHAAGFLHRDISARNVLIHPETMKLYLSDFGASCGWRETEKNLLPARSGCPCFGSYQYLSPEHTGKLSRTVDHRSDLYGLGILFYEMLSGSTPLSGITSRPAILFAHVALEFPPLHQLDLPDRVPLVLSNIIFKLLRKDAESRYQSCLGLLYDLREAQKHIHIYSESHAVIPTLFKQLAASGPTTEDYHSQMFQLRTLQAVQANQSIPESSSLHSPMKLGTKDRAPVLRSFSALHGRDKQIKIIINAFTSSTTSKRNECRGVIASGTSGAGKRIDKALDSILKQDSENREFFVVRAKFPQYSTAPFQCLIEVFSVMLNEIARIPHDGELGDLIENSVGLENVAILSERMIPGLKELFNDLPTPERLTSTETSLRLQSAVVSWIRFVSCEINAMMLFFLDDLQWSDDGSVLVIADILKMIEVPIFFFFAVRNDEIEHRESILNFLHKTTTQNTLQRILLPPLPSLAVNSILSDMTGSQGTELQDLAEVIVQKTKGNPFFVTQFISKLYEEELLVFNFDAQIWEYNLEYIKTLNYTQNVIKFMLQEIKKLPMETLKFLQMGSCVGLTFAVSMLQLISDESSDDITKILQEGLRCGLIQPVFSSGASAKLNNNFQSQDSSDVLLYADHYIFLHDKVHESFYYSMEEPMRTDLHYRIGTAMLTLMKQSSGFEQELFNVVHHLNEGQDYITDRDLALEIVDTALDASIVATEMGTHSQALNYSLFARSLLQKYYPNDDECWKHEYDRCFAILLRVCESRSVLLQPEVLDEFEVAFKRVTDPTQRLDVYTVQFNHLCSQQQVPETVALCIHVMEEYGHMKPDEYTFDTFRSETTKFLKTENTQTLENKFCSLPLATDDKLTDSLLNFIVMASPSFYILEEFLWWAYALHFCCKITYERGLFHSSGVSISSAGFAMQCVLGPSMESIEFSLTGLKICEKMKSSDRDLGIASFYTGLSHMVWTDNQTAAGLLRNAANYGALSYDLNTYSLAHVDLIMVQPFYGQQISVFLSDLLGYMKKTNSLIKENRTDIMVFLWGMYEAQYRLMYDRAPEPIYPHLHKPEVMENIPLFYHILVQFYRMLTWYYLDETSEAVTILDEIGPLIQSNLGGLVYAYEYTFYGPLIRLRASNSKETNQEAIDFLVKSIKKLESYTKVAPVIWAPRLLILKAEKLRAEGLRTLQIFEMYDNACKLAEKAETLQIAAIAADRAHSFLVDNNISLGRNGCLENANEYYLRWGAIAKSNRISSNIDHRKSATYSISGSGSDPKELTLHNTVLNHVTQILTNEGSTTDSITVFSEIILQHAGADKGCIFYNHDNELYILAKWANGETLEVFPLPTEDSSTEPLSANNFEYPFKIINEVVETGTIFSSSGEPHENVQLNIPGSSCCIPMKSRTQVVGALYLENTLLKGAFPEQQQIMLEHLACQIVSIIDRNELNRNLKNTLLDVQKRANMLEALNKMKDDFVTSTSHELRTPLNAILGFSEILLDTPLDEDQQGYCEIINASAEGLLGVINDILDFQRCQNNSLKISQEIFKLRKCFDQVVRLVVIRAASVNIVLDIDDRIEDDFCIQCDPLRIQQILLNLLSNAIKFTEQGHVILRVHVEDDLQVINKFTKSNEIREIGTILKVSVEDTGIGIDPQKRSEMFKPFSQLDSGTTRKYRGTGLGLTITQNLVRILSHNCSEIDYESQVGIGTKFFFHLPSKLPRNFIFTEDDSQEIQRKKNSIRLMSNSVLVIYIPDDDTRRFFLHEIRHVDTELKRFTTSIVETIKQLNLLRNLYQTSLIICYIDTAGVSESELIDVIQATHKVNSLAFLMTNIQQRRHFQSLMSSVPNSVGLLNKPFHKDLVLNYSATVIQRTHIKDLNPRSKAARAKSIGKVVFPRPRKKNRISVL